MLQLLACCSKDWSFAGFMQHLCIADLLATLLLLIASSATGPEYAILIEQAC